MNGPNEISLDIFLDYLKTFNYKLKEDKNTAHNVKKLKFKKDTIYFDTNNPPSSFSNYYQSGHFLLSIFMKKIRSLLIQALDQIFPIKPHY